MECLSFIHYDKCKESGNLHEAFSIISHFFPQQEVTHLNHLIFSFVWCTCRRPLVPVSGSISKLHSDIKHFSHHASSFKNSSVLSWRKEHFLKHRSIHSGALHYNLKAFGGSKDRKHVRLAWRERPALHKHRPGLSDLPQVPCAFTHAVAPAACNSK